MIANLLFGLAVAAMGQEAAPETSTVGPNNDPNQTVCRRQTNLGSRLGTRNICRTRAQWADIDRDQREQTERAQNQTRTLCIPTPTMRC